jgi:hypothetical protein
MRLLLGETDDAPNLRAYGAVPGQIADRIGDVVVAGVAEATQMVRDGKFAAGYVIGLPQGLWSASVDVVEGAVDTATWIADLIAALFTGDFVSFFLGEVDKVADFFGDLEATTEKAGAWFASRWFAEDSFDRGEFRGKVLGYVAFHVVMAVATGGAGASIQARGVFKTVIKLLQAADKLGDAFAWAKGIKKALKGKVPEDVAEKAKRKADGSARGADDAEPEAPKTEDVDSTSDGSPAEQQGDLDGERSKSNNEGDGQPAPAKDPENYINDNPKASLDEVRVGSLLDVKAQTGRLPGVKRVSGAKGPARAVRAASAAATIVSSSTMEPSSPAICTSRGEPTRITSSDRSSRRVGRPTPQSSN